AVIGTGWWAKETIYYTYLEDEDGLPNYYEPLNGVITVTNPDTNATEAVLLSTFSEFNEFQRAATETIIDYLMSITNIRFEYTIDPVFADITFGNFQMAANAGFAYRPETPQAGPGGTTIGDVWINSLGAGNVNPTSSSAGYQVLLHEIGHALGLDHPFERTEPVNSYEDDYRFSVMSYGSHSKYPGLYPHEFMILDLVALRERYGTNQVEAGDGSRHIPQTQRNTAEPERVIDLIVDDYGSNDVLDISQFNGAANILDLRQGALSSVGRVQPPSPPTTIDALLNDPTGNVAIAFGTVIEHAIGGDFADLIIGNAEDNRLSGGMGEDRIYGDGVVFDGQPGYGTADTSGNDVLDGGEQDDELYSGGGEDELYGGAGEDELYGGAGDDILVGGVDFRTSDQDADYLDGEEGCDIIVAGPGDTVAEGEACDLLYDRAYDPQNPDRNLLKGGVKDGWAYHPNDPVFAEGPYIGRYGETYEIVGSDLVITLPGVGSGPIVSVAAAANEVGPSASIQDDTITIEDWEPGDYGIQLRNLVTSLPSPPKLDVDLSLLAVGTPVAPGGAGFALLATVFAQLAAHDPWENFRLPDGSLVSGWYYPDDL
ncbi:MAG: M10 family metallopeptidase C-terminal domain-containing protein, partial [Pseudomonadales bacterium]|nr:M10 family metallopeptidase C-terminal domain-containing protein [Pseudomonadales bacterium]